jgi:hypothetical protein
MANTSTRMTVTFIGGVPHIYRDGVYIGWMQGDKIVSPITEAETGAMLAAALKRKPQQ